VTKSKCLPQSLDGIGTQTMDTIVASNLLDTLSATEKRRITDRTCALVGLLEEWARRHPLIRAARIPMVALVAATVLPRLSVSDTLTVARLMLWIFGVDDRVDERVFTLEEMRRRAKQWYSIARYGPGSKVENSDGFAVMLAEIRKELSKSHLFEPLREYWAGSVPRLVEAMAQELQYGLQYNAYGADALPSLDEYLHDDSLGMYLWQSAALILLRDSSVMERFGPIGEVIKHAGVAIRLYNDVRTFDREMREGGVNSVLIMYQKRLGGTLNTTKKEDTLAKAREHVLRLADSYAQRCYDLIGQLQTASGRFEETTYRLVAFHAHFYGRTEYDYHTTSLAEAHEMLSGSTP